MDKTAEEWLVEGHELRSQGSMTKEAAIVCFDKALELEPDLALAWSFKGQCLHYLHRYSEALPCLRKAIELDPDDAENWLTLAQCAEAHGARDEALAAYRKFFSGKTDDFSEFELDGARAALAKLMGGQ